MVMEEDLTLGGEHTMQYKKNLYCFIVFVWLKMQRAMNL